MRYCRVCGAAFRSARTCPKDRIETDADTFDPLVGRVLGDRYRILGRIAAGGMGQVYRAAHTRIACVFAVKVVWGDFAYDASMQSRFIREAEIASCLQSRHIVRVIDFSHDEGALPYLVMELLDGPSLYDVIVREGALPPDRAVRIAMSIARGLGHAHERGVVHRDLKPENVILVTEEEERDVVKILDFGVARLRDGSERLTSFGTALGTPIYMSPEQFRAQDVDARSDLYSLGIVLYEMLSGKPPFESATLPELTRLHMETAPPSLRASLEPKGAGALDGVVARLLAKHPDARYASAREVVAALREWLEIENAPATIAQPSLPPSRQTREPAVEPVTVAALRRAITEGAPRYNAGDISGCYELYRSVADGIARSSPDAVAVVARLNAACARAATRRDATEAAWDMRYAFDDLLAAQPIACGGDLATDEVARMASIAAKREVEGRFDMLGDYQTMFAQGLAARLRQDASAFTLVSALDRAAQEATRVGGGQAALRIIEPVLAKLRVRSSASTVASNADAPVASSPGASQPLPSAVSDDVRQRVARAIRIGAPAYNQGRHDVCARVYREAANEILQTITNGSQEATVALLKKGLHEASGRVPTDAAWIMRHTFDTLLAGG